MDMKKLKTMLGFNDEDMYEDEDEEYLESESKSAEKRDIYSRNRGNQSGKNSNVYPMNGQTKSLNSEQRISIFKPESFDTAKVICDEMKSRAIIVVNTTTMEPKVAQRLLDFICGASYDAGGDIQEIEPGVYVFSPSMVEVTRNSKAVVKSGFLDFK